MTTADEVIEQILSSPNALHYGAGDGVDMDFYYQNVAKGKIGIFSTAYQPITPVVDRGGSVQFSTPVEIWVLQEGEINEPFAIQSIKIKECTTVAVEIWKRLIKSYDFRNEYFDPTLIKTSSQMVGIKLTGSLYLRQSNIPLC